jgi:uncharacterized membrane protein
MLGTKRAIVRIALSPNRLEALTDGVFAVVMTLLVLELSVPVITAGSVHAELPRRLLDMWPKFLSYAVTFLMLGFMWFHHHRQFSQIRRSDSVLVWINLLFLMCLSLLPFSTSVLGEYIEEQVAVFIYGSNVLVCMIIRYILWVYATGNYRLVNRDMDPLEVRRPRTMLPIGMVVFVIGMGFSFLSTILSICIFASIIMLFTVVSALHYRISVLRPSRQ